MARQLTADDILGIDDIDTEEIELSDWRIDGEPVKLTIRALAMDEVMARGDLTAVQASQALVRMSVVQPVFSEVQVEALFKKRATTVAKLLKAINTLNRFDDEEAAAKEADEFPGE